MGMLLGINYPFRHCGWDFGPEPPGYGARDFTEVRADLTRLAHAGVSIVRWFVLADGFTYGTGPDAPQRRGRAGFRFDALASLAPGFLDDFAALLASCAELGLQLLPVLLDFHFAFPGLDRDSQDARTLALWDRTPRVGMTPSARLSAARERAARLPPGYVKGGRGDVLSDARVGERFFAQVLAPLLARSRQHARAIYAWELINEPEWILRRFPLEPGFRLPRARLCRFMERGLGLIREHGFEATVGFARARTLRALSPALPAMSLNQVHYYPRGPRARLPPARFANGCPTILGELASDPSRLDPWPDLPASQQTLVARLALARAQGYQAALPWSYRASDRATLPEREALERALAAFTRAPAAAT